jgi:hypothetical protein
MTKTKIISLITITLALLGCIYALTSTQTEVTPQVNTQAQSPIPISEVDKNLNILEPVAHDQKIEKSDIRISQTPSSTPVSEVKKTDTQAKVSTPAQSINSRIPNQESVSVVKTELKESQGGFAIPKPPVSPAPTCKTREQNYEDGSSYCAVLPQ